MRKTGSRGHSLGETQTLGLVRAAEQGRGPEMPPAPDPPSVGDGGLPLSKGHPRGAL